MKILISNDTRAAHYYIRMGLARAMTACGHEVVMWDIDKKPVNDAFDEYEPDLFIGQTYNVNRVLRSAIADRPHMKVVMKASEWGSMSKEIDLNKYPILVANEKEKREMLELKEATGKPDYVYVHYHPSYIDLTHGSWIKNGIEAKSQLSAADVFTFTNGEYSPMFESDMTFTGGYWGYKSRVLDEWFMPLCKSEEYKIKIFGNSPWPVGSYCGYISDEYIKHALKSAKICPNLHEPHSQDFGYDIIERPFKLMSNKCFVISDFVHGLVDLFPNCMVYANNPTAFREMVDHFLANPEDTKPYVEHAYDIVMSGHTYFHRVKEMFERLNLINHAAVVDEKYEQIKQRMGL